MNLDKIRADVRAIGVMDAVDAASWTVDGNSDSETARLTLKMLREGDPEADDRLGWEPDLSGEFADARTPRSLAEEVGIEDPGPEILDIISEEYEEAVSTHFRESCERELLKFLGKDPQSQLEE